MGDGETGGGASILLELFDMLMFASEVFGFLMGLGSVRALVVLSSSYFWCGRSVLSLRVSVSDVLAGGSPA